AQLVRVDDPAHGLHVAVDDVDRHDADQAARPVEEHRPRLAVDLGAAGGDSELARPAAALPQTGCTLAPLHRPRPGRALAAAAALGDGVRGEELHEALEVAVADGREEPVGELVAPLPRCLEARLLLPDVPAGAHRELPAVVLALVDDACDLVVAVVEHVV